MKKFVGAFLSFCFIISCTKNHDVTNLPADASRSVKKYGSESNYQNTKEWVTLTSDGEYITSYGGGLTFGYSLPHPTTDPTGVYDGYPIDVPDVSLIGMPGGPGSYGPYFTLLVPSISGGSLSITQNYINQWNDYYKAVNSINSTYYDPNVFTVEAANLLKQAKIDQLPQPALTGNVSPSDPGIIVVKGMLIQDHNSPTRMSVISEKYISPLYASLGVKCVGVSSPSSYHIWFFAPNSAVNGSVTQIQVKNSSGNIITPNDFNIQFTTTGPGAYHISGTVTINSVVYSIVEDLDP